MTNAFLMLRIYLCRLLDNPHFIIKIGDKKVTVFCGKPKPNFIANCQDVISRSEISDGFIYSSKTNKTSAVVIKASFEFDNDTLQQIRNIWSFS
jgi:hypothetical protein